MSFGIDITLFYSILVVFGVLFGSLYSINAYIWKKRIRKSGIKEIDRMKGDIFENYLYEVYKNHGYKGKVTKTSGDYGADLILTKDKVSYVVQAKRYSKPVGVKAVQEVLGAMLFYKCDKAIVVTNNNFTKQARTMAKGTGVALVDREQLITMILKMNPGALENRNPNSKGKEQV